MLKSHLHCVHHGGIICVRLLCDAMSYTLQKLTF